MREPEYGNVDLTTARNINIIEREGVRCELCGGRRILPVIHRDFAIVQRFGVYAHRVCFRKRDEDEAEQG